MNEPPADGRRRAGRIETKPKAVARLKQFRDYVGIQRDPALVADFEQLFAAIEGGTRLPEQFYRAGIDRDTDRMLEELGIKHLHLGGRGSDVLVFLVEYDDRVVFLQINDHKHFRTDPPGSLLRMLYDGALATEDAAASDRVRQRTAARRRTVRAGLKPRRPH